MLALLLPAQASALGAKADEAVVELLKEVVMKEFSSGQSITVFPPECASQWCHGGGGNFSYRDRGHDDKNRTLSDHGTLDLSASSMARGADPRFASRLLFE